MFGFILIMGLMEMYGLFGNEEVEWGFYGGVNLNMFGGYGGL